MLWAFTGQGPVARLILPILGQNTVDNAQRPVHLGTDVLSNGGYFMFSDQERPNTLRDSRTQRHVRMNQPSVVNQHGREFEVLALRDRPQQRLRGIAPAIARARDHPHVLG